MDLEMAARSAGAIMIFLPIRTEIIVGAKGRCVHPSLAVHACDQSNWPGSDQANQQTVGLSLRRLGKVKVQAGLSWHGSLWLH
jgi:hypothetical protein